MHRPLLLFVALFAGLPVVLAGEPGSSPSAQRGYKLLVEKAYLPPDFDQETFDAAWKYWPEPLRSEAEKATPSQRRQLAFTRYGLTPRQGDPTKPLQYVVDEQGNWTMNCFACHGGTVPTGLKESRTWPGAPNSQFALQTLTEETRQAKADLQKALTRMDLGSAFIPLGTTDGTTNAVMFGVVLLALRDADLNLLPRTAIPAMTHHDMDAPPWWHFRKKKMLYIDGFAEKGHRGLMQFNLVRTNGPEKFRAWENDFRDIYAYIESIPVPKYPFAIDTHLADQGRRAFNRVCAACHGTYGPAGHYPEKQVSIDEVGTDRVRLDGLTPAHRAAYGKGWFADYGAKENIDDPQGYVAPPLDGIWASGPYFHNGSVPTLWHVLHPNDRPAIWNRTSADYDQTRVGPAVQEFAELPPGKLTGPEQRRFFDTSAFGKSNEGHLFADALTAAEKRAVLEYLKTL